jgi:hypothetical protein
MALLAWPKTINKNEKGVTFMQAQRASRSRRSPGMASKVTT